MHLLRYVCVHIVSVVGDGKGQGAGKAAGRGKEERDAVSCGVFSSRGCTILSAFRCLHGLWQFITASEPSGCRRLRIYL